MAAAAPAVAGAMPHIGHRAIRSRGTVCGSLAHADPAAELPAVALAVGAEMIVHGPAGQRTMAAGDFFEGYLSSALAEDELLVGVRFPPWAPRAGWSVLEVSRRHGDFALVGLVTTLETPRSSRRQRRSCRGHWSRPLTTTHRLSTGRMLRGCSPAAGSPRRRKGPRNGGASD